VIHGAQVQRREEPGGSRTMQQQQRALRACTEEPSLQSIATATPIVPIVPHPLESVRFRADGRRGAIARAHRHEWRSAVHRCSQRVCCACPERKTTMQSGNIDETCRQAPDVARTGTHNRRQTAASERTGYSAGSDPDLLHPDAHGHRRVDKRHILRVAQHANARQHSTQHARQRSARQEKTTCADRSEALRKGRRWPLF
jgi:hypothetical protein